MKFSKFTLHCHLLACKLKISSSLAFIPIHEVLKQTEVWQNLSQILLIRNKFSILLFLSYSHDANRSLLNKPHYQHQTAFAFRFFYFQPENISW